MAVVINEMSVESGEPPPPQEPTAAATHAAQSAPDVEAVLRDIDRRRERRRRLWAD